VVSLQALRGKVVIQEIMVGVALTLLFMILPLAVIIAPAPAVFYTLKSGRGVGWTIVLLPLAVMTLMAGSHSFGLYLMLLTVGGVALLLPEFLRRGYSGARAVLLAVSLITLVMVGSTAIYAFDQRLNIHAEAVKQIRSISSEAAAFYTAKSGASGEQLKFFQEAIRQEGELATRIYPALLVMGIGMFTAANLLVIKRFSVRLAQRPAIGDFMTFRMPEQLIWLVIAAGFTLLLATTTGQERVVMAALNLLIIMLSLYFMQGLAVIAHFFNRFAVAGFIRLMFYVLLLIFSFMSIAVLVLGVFDFWGNFRAPRPTENL